MKATSAAYLTDQPVAADEQETAAVVELEEYLAAKKVIPAALMSPDGRKFELPRQDGRSWRPRI